MIIDLRQETPNDYQAVNEVIKYAFKKLPQSDHTEHLIVERLRKSSDFIPELSIVAECDHEIVGHILLTPVSIVHKSGHFESLALAPLSVLPKFQNKGIGSELIEAAHLEATLLGFTSVALIGHSGYYGRFGYTRASHFQIQFPFDAPDENCMAIELVEDGLKGVKGIIQYPEPFYSI